MSLWLLNGGACFDFFNTTTNQPTCSETGVEGPQCDGWMDGRRDEHLTKNEQALVGGPVFSSEVLIKKKSAPKLRLRLKDTLSPPRPPRPPRPESSIGNPNAFESTYECILNEVFTNIRFSNAGGWGSHAVHAAATLVVRRG
jgi:hypothetical protein